MLIQLLKIISKSVISSSDSSRRWRHKSQSPSDLSQSGSSWFLRYCFGVSPDLHTVPSALHPKHLSLSHLTLLACTVRFSTLSLDSSPKVYSQIISLILVEERGCVDHSKKWGVQMVWFPKASCRFSYNKNLPTAQKAENSSVSGSPNLETTAVFSNWVTAFQVPKISPVIFSRVQRRRREERSKEQVEDKSSMKLLQLHKLLLIITTITETTVIIAIRTSIQ